MSKFHLKGLDTYRAIAALLVLIHHLEGFKNRIEINSNLDIPFFKNTGGHIGVILFFVLSGFLITLLLLQEKNKFEEINLKKFYLRRIFRVWPLYYFVIFLSFFLFDYSPTCLGLLLCITIFPNIAHALGIGWLVSPQIWSIGVEEQFYLIWPNIIARIKNILVFSIFLFIFLTLLPHGILFILNNYYPDQELMTIVNKIFYGTKFSSMAIGATFAILFFKHESILNIFYKFKILNYIFIILPFVLWIIGFSTKYFTDEIYSLFFAMSILIVSTNPFIIDIDTKLVSFLGKISYGIYMYHWIILEIVYRNGLLIYNSFIANVILYILVIGSTIAIATISFYYFERPFLYLKEKYSTVK